MHNAGEGTNKMDSQEVGALVAGYPSCWPQWPQRAGAAAPWYNGKGNGGGSKAVEGGHFGVGERTTRKVEKTPLAGPYK